MSNINKISIVIINWNNKDYLKRCMDSILNQTYIDLEIIFIDNNSSDGSYEFFTSNYNNDNIISIKNNVNNGYAGAANQGIILSSGEYIMILNPDIVMDENFIEELYKYIVQYSDVGALTGKLLKYDFVKNQKMNIIDSVGIDLYHNRRCVDKGQNEIDLGQYNQVERVFGVCGAAPLFKKSALEEVKVGNEYFDEDFFAYKEDVDLSWRLNLIGYKCMYLPSAVAYHGRKLGGSRGGIVNYIKNRREQSKFLRGLSFRNHLLLLMKNETKESFDSDKYKIYKRISIELVYSLFFEQFNFKYLIEALKYRRRIKSKRLEKYNNDFMELLK